MNNISPYSEERWNLCDNVAHRKMSYKQTLNKINELERKYPNEDIFTRFSIDKKDKSEWDEEYFDKLNNLCMSGAGSKEFILHMAEVSDYLKQKENIPKQIASILAGVISIIAIAKIIQKKKKNNNIDALVNELEDIKKELNDIKKIKEPTKKDIKRAEKLKVRADKIINRIKELKDKE